MLRLIGGQVALIATLAFSDAGQSNGPADSLLVSPTQIILVVGDDEK